MRSESEFDIPMFPEGGKGFKENESTRSGFSECPSLVRRHLSEDRLHGGVSGKTRRAYRATPGIDCATH